MQIRRIDTKETTYHMQGRMTFQDNEAFRAIMSDVSQGRQRRIVLDLSGLEYVDSFAIGLFLVARDEAEAKGSTLEFRNPMGAVRRVFELAELDAVLNGPPPISKAQPLRHGGLSVSAPHEREPGHVTVALGGRLTFADHEPFDRLMKALSAKRYAQVDLDLEGLEFIDSAGLSMLMIARDELAKDKGEVRLISPMGAVARLLDLAAIDTVMTVLARPAA